MAGPGRHFLQIPGPTNVPEPVLHALARATVDHRGPEFEALVLRLLPRLAALIRCSGPVLLFPGSGSGAWEAALVNTCAPGARLLMVETGHFASQWKGLAERLGYAVDWLPGDWDRGADVTAIESRLRADDAHAIRAVAIVHNETSTGAVSDVAAVRAALDAVGHPALLLVDTVSSLVSLPYDHDAWGVDVTVAASQKGLMLPPGLALNAVSAKALAAAEAGGAPRGYWDWRPVVAANRAGRYPYTPPSNLFVALEAALDLVAAEGLDAIHARHRRHAAATRAAVAAWGLNTVCRDPAAHSATLTAVRLPEGHDADAFRATVLDRFNLALGNGLGRLDGRVFRIGHLGDFNDLMLAGTLSGVEMGLRLAGVPHAPGGVQAALAALADTAQ